MRVVRDEDVDRAQVHRRRRHSRALLIARSFPHQWFFSCILLCPYANCQLSIVNCQFPACQQYIAGVYCGGVPPLPIPNRAVKPACADGTARQCGRVGGCPFFFTRSLRHTTRALFFCGGWSRGVRSWGVRQFLLQWKTIEWAFRVVVEHPLVEDELVAERLDGEGVSAHSK